MGGCGGGCGGDRGSASPVKWAIVTVVSPLTVRFSGDSVDVEIDLYDRDITWAMMDNAVLVEVAPRRWAAIGKFS